MARFLILLLLSFFFFFSFTSGSLSRKALSTELPAIKNKSKILSPSSKNQTKIKNSDAKDQIKTTNSDTKYQIKIRNSDAKDQSKIKNSDEKDQIKIRNSDANDQIKINNSDPKDQIKIKNSDVKDQIKIKNSDAKDQIKIKNSDVKDQIKITNAQNPSKEDEEEEEEEDGSDLIAEFSELTQRFQETLHQDFQKVFSKAKKRITNTMQPLLGRRYAGPLTAAFFVGPLALSLLLLRFLSLQTLLLYGHAYVALYFAVLFLASLLTGLEPLRLMHATWPRAYVALQVVQAGGYVALVGGLVVGVVVGPARASTLAPLAAVVGVGVHYFAAVLRRAIAGEAPRTSWRAHFLYSVCFFVIFSVFRAKERRKKSYLDDAKNS